MEGRDDIFEDYMGDQSKERIAKMKDYAMQVPGSEVANRINIQIVNGRAKELKVTVLAVLPVLVDKIGGSSNEAVIIFREEAQ